MTFRVFWQWYIQSTYWCEHTTEKRAMEAFNLPGLFSEATKIAHGSLISSI